jgi:hypothetical protein
MHAENETKSRCAWAADTAPEDLDVIGALAPHAASAVAVVIAAAAGERSLDMGA